MIRHLKNRIPIGYKLRINHWLHGKTAAIPKSKAHKPIIYFFLAAGCNNLGDVAISLSIEKFATTYFPDYTLLQIPLYETLSYISPVNKNINPDDIIFLVGGGNMGDMYEDIEFYRQTIIRKFPDNLIISFPQSIFFSSEKKALKSSSIYNRHRHLIILGRDNVSYQRMQQLYPSCKVLLMPDIVMTLNKVSDTERSGLLLCLRNDWEKCNHDKEVSDLIARCGDSDIERIDNMVSTRVSLAEKEQYIDSHLEHFRRAKLLITDRLHGMIFGYITATPTLFLDNSTKKISACYEWISSCRYVQPATGMSELQVASISENLHLSQDSIIEKYREFAAIIRSELEKLTNNRRML